MAKIQFQTGVEEYRLNDKVSVWFNPTDTSFIRRLFDTFSKLDTMQEEYGKRISETQDTNEILNTVAEADTKIRKMIDDLFETNVSTELFAGISTYALAGGLPIWANLLLAIIDEIDASYVSEAQKTDPRMEKYVSKYKKKGTV